MLGGNAIVLLCAVLVVALVVGGLVALERDAPEPSAAPARRARFANVGASPPTRRSSNKYPVVRAATVARTPLQTAMPTFPSEHVLDDAMLAEQRRRSQTANGHLYHTQALPNAIRAAARELTTPDPNIVPLDGGAACVRRLGVV